MLKITREVLEKLQAHAQKEAPLEACGYLARDEAGQVADEWAPLRNVDQSRMHYSMDSREQLEVIRRLRSRQKRICAVYHSHPVGPARMSREDIRLAHDPALSYVIISLTDRENAIRSFRLENATAVEEELEFVESVITIAPDQE